MSNYEREKQRILQELEQKIYCVGYYRPNFKLVKNENGEVICDEYPEDPYYGGMFLTIAGYCFYADWGSGEWTVDNQPDGIDFCASNLVEYDDDIKAAFGENIIYGDKTRLDDLYEAIELADKYSPQIDKDSIEDIYDLSNYLDEVDDFNAEDIKEICDKHGWTFINNDEGIVYDPVNEEVCYKDGYYYTISYCDKNEFRELTAEDWRPEEYKPEEYKPEEGKDGIRSLDDLATYLNFVGDFTAEDINDICDKHGWTALNDNNGFIAYEPIWEILCHKGDNGYKTSIYSLNEMEEYGYHFKKNGGVSIDSIDSFFESLNRESFNSSNKTTTHASE